MGYEIALNKSWENFLALNPAENLKVRFLADEYEVNLALHKILSLSCNIPVKDHISILILHYLVKKLNGLPELTGKWLDFKELSAIEGYQSAFRQRVIERIIRKYGTNPPGILSVLERFPAKEVKQADVGIVLDVFEGVPLLIELWKKDEEFAPDANILFDKSITDIFCIEDIVVLAETAAHSL